MLDILGIGSARNEGVHRGNINNPINKIGFFICHPFYFGLNLKTYI